MALSLCCVAFVHQSWGLLDLEQGSIWNQFSNLYSNWVELEYPHRNNSGTKRYPLTVSDRPFLLFGEVPVGWMHYLFYKVWYDLCTNLYSVFLGHSELLRLFSEIRDLCIQEKHLTLSIRKQIAIWLRWLKYSLMWGGRSGFIYFTLEKSGPTTILEIHVWASKPGTGRCSISLQNFC